MQTTTKLAQAALAAAFLLLLAVLAVTVAENLRMKNVLIEHTLDQLERDYQAARRAENETTRALRASLEDAFAELTNLRGLSADETELISTAIALTDEILQAATSRGLNLD